MHALEIGRAVEGGELAAQVGDEAGGVGSLGSPTISCWPAAVSEKRSSSTCTRPWAVRRRMVSISRLVPGTASSSGSKPAMISTSSAGRRLEASVVARRKRASVSEIGCMAGVLAGGCAGP
jgi:hypothetical protein